jgi:DUF4097 and DUF4098 domain-containing protein YvlB
MKNLINTIIISLLVSSFAAASEPIGNILTPFSSISEFVENSIIHEDNLQVLHEKTFNISPGKALRVEADQGDVMITSWDKPEVYVKVLGNEKAKDKMDFSFNGTEDEVKIKAKREGSFFNFFSSGIKLRFEIKVPSDFNDYVATSGGDIRLGGVKGNNKLSTSGGDISLKSLSGKVDATTSGGDISVEGSDGEIELSTSGGDINARDFKGNLSLSTSGGDIEIKGSDAKITAETSGGDITLDYSGVNKGIDLETSGGNIQILLPSDFNASAKLSTSGGEISSEFKGNNAVKISSSKFEADLNKGGERLSARTSGGDIILRKH